MFTTTSKNGKWTLENYSLVLFFYIQMYNSLAASKKTSRT